VDDKLPASEHDQECVIADLRLVFGAATRARVPVEPFFPADVTSLVQVSVPSSS